MLMDWRRDKETVDKDMVIAYIEKTITTSLSALINAHGQ